MQIHPPIPGVQGYSSKCDLFKLESLIPEVTNTFVFFPQCSFDNWAGTPSFPSPNCGHPSCSRSANNVLMTSWRPINSPMLRHPSGRRTSQRFVHVLGMPDESCHQRDCNLLFVQKSASVYICFEGFELFDYRVLWRLSTQYYAVLYIVHTSCFICLPLALMICIFFVPGEGAGRTIDVQEHLCHPCGRRTGWRSHGSLIWSSRSSIPAILITRLGFLHRFLDKGQIWADDVRCMGRWCQNVVPFSQSFNLST